MRGGDLTRIFFNCLKYGRLYCTLYVSQKFPYSPPFLMNKLQIRPWIRVFSDDYDIFESFKFLKDTILQLITINLILNLNLRRPYQDLENFRGTQPTHSVSILYRWPNGPFSGRVLLRP